MGDTEILKSIKLRIGIDDNLQDELLMDIIADANAMVLGYINQDGNLAFVVPADASWVIKDVAVKMFNRIGDEGKTSSGEGNVSNAWETIDLSQYADALDKHRNSNLRRRPGMRFV
ncbi:phage head-tail connector protein [Latilactobacillus sakei]|uniref:Phage head-tail connector protein n=1 Tax=Latilactobacillus sakei TaxID=1599 RepID=A0AAF0K3J9_LATSK|nr:phage head-tail connector protein [Latilactobacillus sakei]WGI18559.1 phage head-tail connector protein [Latilactobacillus sakei]